jgi:hypothetical protein
MKSQIEAMFSYPVILLARKEQSALYIGCHEINASMTIGH